MRKTKFVSDDVVKLRQAGGDLLYQTFVRMTIEKIEDAQRDCQEALNLLGEETRLDILASHLKRGAKDVGPDEAFSKLSRDQKLIVIKLAYYAALRGHFCDGLRPEEGF